MTKLSSKLFFNPTPILLIILHFKNGFIKKPFITEVLTRNPIQINYI